jgi:hypothetical protein
MNFMIIMKNDACGLSSVFGEREEGKESNMGEHARVTSLQYTCLLYPMTSQGNLQVCCSDSPDLPKLDPIFRGVSSICAILSSTQSPRPGSFGFSLPFLSCPGTRLSLATPSILQATTAVYFEKFTVNLTIHYGAISHLQAVLQ